MSFAYNEFINKVYIVCLYSFHVLHMTVEFGQVLQSFGSSSQLDLGESKGTLAAAAELEAALVEHVFSSPQTALGHLQAAGDALGMHTIVEG